MDAIQVGYYMSKDGFVKAPRRGGHTGGLTHIRIPCGAKVIGVTGEIGDRPDYRKVNPGVGSFGPNQDFWTF